MYIQIINENDQDERGRRKRTSYTHTGDIILIYMGRLTIRITQPDEPDAVFDGLRIERDQFAVDDTTAGRDERLYRVQIDNRDGESVCADGVVFIPVIL